MSTPMRPTPDLHLVVGYDGSPPAQRALDSAIRLMGSRTGRITAVYVAHLTSTVQLSADAVAEMESDFDQIEQELRSEVGERLRGLEVDWEFERRQGLIAEQLIGVAKEIQAANPDDIIVIVVGSSSHAMHRMVGSVAVNLARHAPVPLVVVP